MTRDQAIAKLREVLKPGDTVQTILRHKSRSGMLRSVSPVVQGEDISYLVAPACGLPFDRKHGGVRMGGCGMDMSFALVYDLSHVLWPEGFGCIGERCLSNDHNNGDQDYTPAHWHRDGGYALRHRWL